MTKALVTGGTGFLGSHLCRKLLSLGYEVICLDNNFTGSLNNIKDLMNQRNFEYVRHDVTHPYDIPCDVLFNLACPASPVHYQFNPIKTSLTSVLGAIHALENAHKYKATVMQASTSEIYGDPECSPQPEEYRGNVNTVGPRSCYDESKRMAETLFNDYRIERGVDTRIVRIFNTYGPNMNINDGRVVSNFIVNAINGKDLVVYGYGEQTRSFCYVDDLIEGFLTVGMSQVHEPINIGNPSPMTIFDLASLVITKINSGSQIRYAELPIDDPKQREPDISKAKALGWEPKVGLEEGLNKTIDYFLSITK